MQQELANVRKECSMLRAEIEFINQQGRINNVEICGVPEKRNENIMSVIKNVGSALGTTISDQDIVTGHRVARYSKDETTRDPKNIVIKFTSLAKKVELLNAAKLKRNTGIYANNIGYGENTKIYVNEHLSPYYKTLHKKAREFCKNFNYKYCWIKEMKIFIKKEDNSRAICISNEHVLSSLRV